MNRNLSLVLVGAAAVCGLALAQVPQPKQDTAAQIAALQKRVDALEAQVADMAKAKPGASADFEAAVAKDRQALEAVVHYLHGQSSAAEKLQTALADSKDKGFTFGINPDSRTVLLDGFHNFAEQLKAELPAEAPPPANAPKTAPLPTKSTPPPPKTPAKTPAKN